MPRAKVDRHTAGTATPAPAPSLRDETKAMYRRAVLTAAEIVLAEHGVEGARIQDIAKLARVSVGTVYNHFAQKEDIVSALLADREREFLDTVQVRPEDPPGFEGRFRARFERILQLIIKHRAFFTFALYEGLLESEPIGARSAVARSRGGGRDRFCDASVELLKQGMDEGVVDRQEPMLLQRFMAGALRDVMLGALHDPDGDPVAQGRIALDLCLRAIRPVGGKQSPSAPAREPGKPSRRAKP